MGGGQAEKKLNGSTLSLKLESCLANYLPASWAFVHHYSVSLLKTTLR